MGFSWLPAPVDLELSAGWTTLTWSTKLTYPSWSPTGAIIRITGGDANNYGFDWRMTGGSGLSGIFSTDINKSSQWWGVVGITGGTTDLYVEHISVDIQILGWCDDFVGLSTPVIWHAADLTGDAWNTLDLSVECPDALALSYETAGLGFTWAIRPNGSTDDLSGGGRIYGVIGCDTSQKIQFKPSKFGAVVIDAIAVRGYFTALVDMETNGIQLSDPSSFVTWVEYDLSALVVPGIQETAFFKVISSSGSQAFGVRKRGTSLNHQAASQNQQFGMVELDDEGIFEIYVGSTAVDVYLVGVGSVRYATYPTDDFTRVTGLIHRYDKRAGIYQLEMSFGDVTSVMSLPYSLNAKRATAVKQFEQDNAPLKKAIVEYYKGQAEDERRNERRRKLQEIPLYEVLPVAPPLYEPTSVTFGSKRSPLKWLKWRLAEPGLGKIVVDESRIPKTKDK